MGIINDIIRPSVTFLRSDHYIPGNKAGYSGHPRRELNYSRHYIDGMIDGIIYSAVPAGTPIGERKEKKREKMKRKKEEVDGADQLNVFGSKLLN